MNLDYLKRINICVDLISEAEYFILPRFIFANDIFFFFQISRGLYTGHEVLTLIWVGVGVR